MKVAFSTSGGDPAAPLERRFGRAPRFLLYDPEAGEFAVIENRQSLEMAQGAGIQSAERVVRAGARAVVTGHCGPKAFRVLSAAGVKVYASDAPSVVEAHALFQAGALKEIEAPDVEGHWV